MQEVALLQIEDRRPSLLDLWNLYRFHSDQLAVEAKVPLGAVQAMLCNQPIPRDYAQKILDTLSALLHKKVGYTLQSTYVALAE
jgi:hypothetical protein